MSREIKVRFWDKKLKAWLDDKYEEHNIYNLAFKYGLNWDHIENPEERVSIIECTGLNDKNGNPIYEGHILTNVNGRYKNNNLLVKWNDKECYYDLVYKGHSLVKKLTKNNVEKAVIVGHVFENPTLNKI